MEYCLATVCTVGDETHAGMPKAILTNNGLRIAEPSGWKRSFVQEQIAGRRARAFDPVGILGNASVVPLKPE